MKNITIVWLDNSGNMVPNYGIPNKGDILIVPEEIGKQFIKDKMAKLRTASKPSIKKEDE